VAYDAAAVAIRGMNAQTNFPQAGGPSLDALTQSTTPVGGIPSVVKAKKNSKAHRYMQGYCSDTDSVASEVVSQLSEAEEQPWPVSFPADDINPEDFLVDLPVLPDHAVSADFFDAGEDFEEAAAAAGSVTGSPECPGTSGPRASSAHADEDLFADLDVGDLNVEVLW
jgi:hypothetical protein